MNGIRVTRQRLYFFDNLKASVILLVIVFHVAMSYTTWKLEWWVNDSQSSVVFDLFILAADVFIMPVMFLTAGYFGAAALAGSGTALFWQAKLWRIVIPWLGGVVFIAPLIAYSALVSHMDMPPDYFSFLVNRFLGPYYQQAHYWFLGILTLFFIFLTLAYRINPAYFTKQSPNGGPAGCFFPAFAACSAVPFFAANLFFPADAWVNCYYLFMIQPVRIGLYLCYFGLGVHAWKNSWFTEVGYQPRLLPWGMAFVIMLFVFLGYRVLFTLAPNPSVAAKAGHAALFSVFCLSAVFAAIAFFLKYANSGFGLWRSLAANSYTMYYIHQCVLIPLAFLVQPVQANVFGKYAIVSAAAAAICYFVAVLMTKLMQKCKVWLTRC